MVFDRALKTNVVSLFVINLSTFENIHIIFQKSPCKEVVKWLFEVMADNNDDGNDDNDDEERQQQQRRGQQLWWQQKQSLKDTQV